MSWVAFICYPELHTDGRYKAVNNPLDEEAERLRRKKRQEEEETQRKRSDELDRQAMNAAMGDITGSGIPGGYDMNITTPL